MERRWCEACTVHIWNHHTGWLFGGDRITREDVIDYEKEIEEELQEWPKRHRRKIMNGP